METNSTKQIGDFKFKKRSVFQTSEILGYKFWNGKFELKLENPALVWEIVDFEFLMKSIVTLLIHGMF
jgi:hypothetical protein